MSQARWTSVDDFITDSLLPADPALAAALRDSEAAGLPAIQVTPNQGKLLQILARLVHARAILEIGTLGGYSTIWMARALPPGGKLITLELDAAHADVARRNVERAGLAGAVEVLTGRALDTLPRLQSEARGPFDLIFIDADKQSNPEYFRWALRLSRAGSLIVVDNVVRDGEVVNAASTDPAIRGTRELYKVMAAEPRVSATAIQTVGGKGYDGLAVALVIGA